MPKGLYGKAKRRVMKNYGDHSYYHIRGERSRGRSGQSDSGELQNHYTSLCRFDSDFQSDWVSEQKQRYKDYTGVDPSDTSECVFSLEEMIEKYAKELAFWTIEKRLVENEPDKYLIVSNAFLNIFSRAGQIFDSDQMRQVLARHNELVSQKL